MGGLSLTVVWELGTYGLYGKFTIDSVLIFFLIFFLFSQFNFFLFIRYLCVYLTEAILIKKDLFWLMISQVPSMVVWLLWQWVYVAEESYSSHGSQSAERGKRLGTQCDFQSHTPVTCSLHLYPPTKFPQPRKAVPPAEDKSFPTPVCCTHFILKPSQIVMHPGSCLRYLGDSMEMTDFIIIHAHIEMSH